MVDHALHKMGLVQVRAGVVDGSERWEFDVFRGADEELPVATVAAALPAIDGGHAAERHAYRQLRLRTEAIEADGVSHAALVFHHIAVEITVLQMIDYGQVGQSYEGVLPRVVLDALRCGGIVGIFQALKLHVSRHRSIIVPYYRNTINVIGKNANMIITQINSVGLYGDDVSYRGRGALIIYNDATVRRVALLEVNGGSSCVVHISHRACERDGRVGACQLAYLADGEGGVDVINGTNEEPACHATS